MSVTNEEENKEETEDDLSNDHKKLIKQLQDKCKLSKEEEKIKILSLLPNSWSKQRIFKEFDVTDYQVGLSRELMKSRSRCVT